MKRLRKVAFCLLVMYASLTLAISLHSHPLGTDGASLHCNLCQLSQTCLEEAGTPRIVPVVSKTVFFATESVPISSVQLVATVPQRAPPIA